MTASLVSLFRDRRGWTNEERAQFARIERLLEDAGFAVDVEHGLSDEGEPWCVFCSRITGDVIIHVACIDGRFMFDSSTLPRPIEGASFERCAARFFDDVSLPLPLNDRRGKVYLHPSAMLASLFITVLLYAQATTEQPLFDLPAVDVDDPDAPEAVLSPLALRLKAIAQQVADFVATPDGKENTAQAHVSPAMAAIPAGMALAVIAIAQDLANAAELAWTDDESAALALLGSAAAEIDDETRAAPVLKVVEAPKSVEDEERIHADATGSPEAKAPESEVEMPAPDLEEIGAAIAAAIEAANAAVLSLVRLPGEVLLGKGLAFELASGTDAAGGPDAVAGAVADASGGVVESAIAALFEMDFGAAADSFVFALSGRLVELEIVRLSEEMFDRFSLALLDGSVEDSFELVSDDDDVRSDGGVTSDGGIVQGGTGARPGDQAGAGGDALAGLPGGSRDPAVVPPAPEDPAAPAPRSPVEPDARVVGLDELEDLRIAYLEAVGDAFEFVTDAHGDRLFLDASINEHVQSRDIHVEHVYLEDGSKVSFLGLAWDFDGFA